MAAVLHDATASQIPEPTVVQLAFWQPDKVIVLSTHALRKKHLCLVVSAPAVFTPEHPVALTAAAIFPCTWPKCDRGPSRPFYDARALANHRFAAHGIRSSNEESIARQARRDKKRALAKDNAPPEYIDVEHIKTAASGFFPVKLPDDIKTGALDPGDREWLRRRIAHHLIGWMHEIKREPKEIVVVIAQLAAAGLVPPRLIPDRKESERFAQRLTDLLELPRNARMAPPAPIA